MRSDLVSDRIVGALVVFGAATGALWLMVRVRIALLPSQLVISNIRSKSIPYKEITDLNLGYEGLRVRTGTRTYVSLAVQKWNVSKMLGRRTRADEIADEIRVRVAAAHRP